MRARREDLFTTIRTEGAILPPNLLQRIAAGDGNVDGLSPEAYHLGEGERVNEAINRAWNRLLGAWSSFSEGRKALAPDDPGTTLTRERWLLVLFQELGYGRLLTAKAFEVEGKTYPISHAWHHTPIHLVGCGINLDHRTAGVAGAARSSPHSLVQELLNQRKENLWGFVSNGLSLRILRDNASLTRQAYVEFDLNGMMTGEVYADFVLLWLLCHESRVEAEQAEACWLERWSQAAQQQGTRALEQLRAGVEHAITELGRGFLSHPANRALRDRLRSGALDKQDYYRQLLRVVYRLLFLFVAEDRGLLLDPDADAAARDRYVRFYSTRRLRQLAGRRRGAPHVDLFRGLRLVMEKLGDDAGCPPLALPALGSFLWSPRAMPDLAACDIANRDILEAMRALAFTTDGQIRLPVDYKNLGAEELGSVYESLLELHPDINVDAGTFELKSAGGHERKTTGSYYTPSSLVQCLLDSALDPVLAEAAKQPNPETAILHLKVCDPACGSGHFLIAAAHRMGKRLARVRSGDEEPAPEATRTAVRDVIGHCIYAVDANEMAVELCKVSLWMEALEPGKPLSFLDHRIVFGNSLLGTTPALLAKGIPDEAFTALEGDDKKMVSALRKQNKQEREGQTAWHATPWLTGLVVDAGAAYSDLAAAAAAIDALDDVSIARIHQKEDRHHRLTQSEAYVRAKLVADAWCAAFVWKKALGAPEAVTGDVLQRLTRDPNSVRAPIRDEILRLAHQYNFLHWHLAFPEVFRLPEDGEPPTNEQARWNGGFGVVLGNPPWERIKLQEKEWFAGPRPDIAGAPNAAARRKLIAALATEDPALYAAWLEDSRKAEGESHLVRNSGRYPLCGRGDINTYAVFTETNRLIMAPTGRAGCIVPTGIATDDTTKFFFQDLVRSRALSSLYSFFETRRIFIGTDNRNPFCLMTLSASSSAANLAPEFAFDLRSVSELRDPERRFPLHADDIALLNPNTRTCPVFRSARDAELTKAIYRRVPVLIREGPPEENPWGVSFMRMFDMANDSHLFRTRAQLEADGLRLDGNVFDRGDDRCLPLYEAKMIHHFDHRFGDYADKPEGSESTALPQVPVERLQDARYFVLPRYWVPAGEVQDRLRGKWDRGWLLGWRDICRSTDERTVIASALPCVGVGHKFPLFLLSAQGRGSAASVLATLASFPFDYVARQKLGGTSMTYFYLKQLPILPPAAYDRVVIWAATQRLSDWLLPRILELALTSRDLAAFGHDCDYTGPPFRWDDARRFLLRCELDAAIFHLYLPADATGEWHAVSGETPEQLATLKRYFPAPRDAVDYLMETFPIVKRKDIEKHGEFRTKHVILEIYDAMQRAIATGKAYQTLLDPPPADPRVAHPAGQSS